MRMTVNDIAEPENGTKDVYVTFADGTHSFHAEFAVPEAEEFFVEGAQYRVERS